MGNKNKKKEPLLSSDSKFTLSVVAGAILLLGVILYFGMGDEPKESPVEVTKAPVINFDTENQTKIGDPEAPVQVVEFFDFQCSHCQTWNAEIFDDLKKDYIDTGKVELVSINFPFLGSESVATAMLFESIGAHVNAEKAFEFKSALMKSITQDKEKPADVFKEKNILAVAENLLTEEEFALVEKSFDEKEFRDEVASDETIAKESGVQGTPSVFLNGSYFPGGADKNALYQELDRLISE